MKKALSIVLVLVTVFCLAFSTVTTANAATFLNYKVRFTSSVYMKQYPTSSSTSIVKIPTGTISTVTSKSGNWGYVSYGKYNGWADLRYSTSHFMRSVPMVVQTRSNTCGSACGSMILKQLRKDVSEIKFWNKSNENGEGTYVYRVRYTLNYFLGSNKYSYHNMSSKLAIDYYKKIQGSLYCGYPVTLPLRYTSTSEFGYKTNGHYVVIREIYVSNDACYVKVNDPKTGNIVILSLNNLIKYNKAHSGYIISYA